jgi:hypothetical protein
MARRCDDRKTITAEQCNIVAERNACRQSEAADPATQGLRLCCIEQGARDAPPAVITAHGETRDIKRALLLDAEHAGDQRALVRRIVSLGDECSLPPQPITEVGDGLLQHAGGRIDRQVGKRVMNQTVQFGYTRDIAEGFDGEGSTHPGSRSS